MQYSNVILASVLAALVSASPAIDPLTVTSLSPSQSSALASAEASYLSSLTLDPNFSSVMSNLITNTAALAAVGALATLAPTGTDAVAVANSYIKELPSDVAPFFSSALNEQIVIASSVVNNGAVTTGKSGTGKSSTGSTSTKTGSSGGSGSSAAGSAGAQTQSGSGAAPTNAVKVGGAALAMLGAAVAML